MIYGKKRRTYSSIFKVWWRVLLEAIKKQEPINGISLENCITIFDKEYPKRFFDLKYPPLVLFYKGDISLLNDEEIIGIVGTRKPSDYSLKAVEYVIDKNKDSIYVSGLAHGIDAKVHDYSNKSIGVLGCGIDYIYPASNKYLYNKLIKNGLIISEYPGKIPPLGYHFPFRNRIIAALSNQVNIMELTERSGTMTTVNEALELGKEIKVLPFSVFSDPNIYNNKLINEGASIIE